MFGTGPGRVLGRPRKTMMSRTALKHTSRQHCCMCRCLVRPQRCPPDHHHHLNACCNVCHTVSGPFKKKKTRISSTLLPSAAHPLSNPSPFSIFCSFRLLPSRLVLIFPSLDHRYAPFGGLARVEGWFGFGFGVNQGAGTGLLLFFA